MTVQRFDFGRITSVQPTPQGGRLVPAAVTRTGVFPYRRADGSIRRELRLPEEVFHEDSLATLKGAPVTDLHPPEMVTPENFSKYSIGHVKDDVRHDDRLVHAPLAVQEKNAITKLDNKERKECSLGYECNLEDTSGVWNGERYDAIQRDIRYNHCAIGPENWGRAGSEVSMRLDSKEEDAAICHLDDVSDIEGDSQTNNDESKPQMKKVTIDSIEYDFGSAGHVQALEKQIRSEQVRADSAEADIKGGTDKVAELEGKLEAETKRADTAEGELATANDPKRLDSRVKERQALIERASKLDKADKAEDKINFDGLSEREIMVAALRADDADFDDTDRPDAFIEGMFGQAVKSAEKRADSKSTGGSSHQKLAAASKQPAKKTDGKDEDAKETFRKDSREAWQKPLKMSNRAS